MTVLWQVISCATSSSLITDSHRRGRRPIHRTRTPQSLRMSRRRRITSRLNPIRKRTSSGERFQFSVEKAYAERFLTPISMAPATTSSRDASPASWPLVRGRPRAFAQRPLPSMTIATCPGTSSGGRTGGRAPDGCGNGGLLTSYPLDKSQGAHAALQMPLQEGGHQATALTTMLGQALVGNVPVAAEQSRQQLQGGQSRVGRAWSPAGRADRAAAGEVESTLGPGRAAPCAVVKARRPPRDRQRPQQVGVQYQPRLVLATSQCAQPAGQQQELLHRWLALLGEPLGGLEHGARRGVGDIVARDRIAIRGKG